MGKKKTLYVLVDDFRIAYPSGERYDHQRLVLRVIETSHDILVVDYEASHNVGGQDDEWEFELRNGVWWEINSEAQFIVLDYAKPGDRCSLPTRKNF